ncbi:putative citrate lyase subunit beta-like protein, mitochondrial-like [Apostichopus japonicus]|uniref:Citramalyl-CoA lyase, mitochondrial n=3 Tax=Stichopus japonicus TaxID=307972 RepID=A0A2G8KVT6_STIJA|nr:putative citrate lyase subunit beta-like protein, mitochondrial-like [Apostichopus japonicus]
METKPRRAMLYVPGSDERKLKKLTDLEVDCAVMDCEDGVAVNKKVDARNTIRSMLDRLSCPGVRDLAVRVNSVSSGLADEDLMEIFKAERLPSTVMLPKVESKAEVQWFVKTVKSQLSKRSSQAPLRVVIFTETAIGLLRLPDILEECQRASDATLVFEGVVFGSDDFCASIGATRTADAHELLYARQKVVATAKAFGMQAIDLVYIDFKDSVGLEEQSLQGARMGFTGKQVIHPNQIPIVQTAFSPSEERIKWAQELISAFEQHQATGKGAFDFKGSMIDMPTVLQARNILKLAEVNS